MWEILQRSACSEETKSRTFLPLRTTTRMMCLGHMKHKSYTLVHQKLQQETQMKCQVISDTYSDTSKLLAALAPYTETRIACAPMNANTLHTLPAVWEDCVCMSNNLHTSMQIQETAWSFSTLLILHSKRRTSLLWHSSNLSQNLHSTRITHHHSISSSWISLDFVVNLVNQHQHNAVLHAGHLITSVPCYLFAQTHHQFTNHASCTDHTHQCNNLAQDLDAPHAPATYKSSLDPMRILTSQTARTTKPCIQNHVLTSRSSNM